MRTGFRRFACSWFLFVLTGICRFGIASAAPALGGGSGFSAAPGFFDSLAAREAHAYRVEGVWSSRCDSMIVAGGTSLDCFVVAGELPIETPSPYLILLADLSRYEWAPSSHGWNSPSTPSLALTFDTDTMEVTLLVSLKDHRATMTIPGKGTAACSLPERDNGELAWCLWGLDPENPEVQPFMRSELKRLGLDPGTIPGDDFPTLFMRALAPPPQNEVDARGGKGRAAGFESVDYAGLHVNDPGLLMQLGARPPSTMYRLVPTSDSTAGPYARSVGLTVRPPRVLSHLMTLLAGCVWVRSGAWAGAPLPSILLHWGPDKAGLDLLLCPEGRAMVSKAGEGSVSAQLPDPARSDLAWCLWALDPESGKTRQAVESILLREGRVFRNRVPPDVKFLEGFTPPPPALSGPDVFDEAPEVVTAPLAVYPEMAKEAQIEGKVVLRVLVGKDGRVQDIVVMRGVSYLNETAKDAAMHRIYKPARLHGDPVSVWIDVPFEFHLP